MTQAKDIAPGQTVIEPVSNKPALVWRTDRTPNGMVQLMFLVPNEHNTIAWIAEPDEPVTVAPLEPVLPWDGVDHYHDQPPRCMNRNFHIHGFGTTCTACGETR